MTSGKEAPLRRRQRIAALAASVALLAGCTLPFPVPGPNLPSTGTGPVRYDQVEQCGTASPDAPVEKAARSAVEQESTLGQAWAGMPVGQALLTTETSQYVAYYDAKRQLVLAQRAMGKDGEPTSSWRMHQLETTLGWDSHNYVTMAVDRDGALHVAGNMHRDPLFYVRTAPGGDIRTAERVDAMVDPDREDSVTYPAFLRQADGSLIFYYRDGGSGSGSIYLNRYREKDATWTDAVGGKLFDGQETDSHVDEDANAYITDPVLGEDGYFHVLWVWRSTPDVSTNSTLTYGKTKDFATWFSADGKKLNTPFVPGEGDVIDPVAEGGGLVNGIQRIGFDHAGKAVVTYAKYDDKKSLQLYAAEPDGDSWAVHQLTRWKNSFTIKGVGTLSPPVTVQGAVADEHGTLMIDYTCGGAPMALAVDDEWEFLSQTRRRSTYGGDVRATRGEFPGLTTRVLPDLAEEQGYEPRRAYVLRWESLGTNRDQPRQDWPREGSPLSVLLLDDK